MSCSGVLLLLLLVCRSLRLAESLGGNNSSRGCSLPDFPEDGSYRVSKYDKKIVPGDIANPYTILTYSCDEGYDPTKSLSVCRNDNNTWTTSLQCLKRCDMLTPETVLFKCFSPKNSSTDCLRKLRHGSVIRPAFKDEHSSVQRELGTLQCTNGRWETVIPAREAAGESGSCSSMALDEQQLVENAKLISELQLLKSQQKEESIMALPYLQHFEYGLNLGMVITIKGFVQPKAFRLPVILKNGPDASEVALLFSPRFETNQMVRNHFSNNTWGPEETFGPVPVKFSQHFHYEIRVLRNKYEIFVDGVHYCDFVHRLPFNKVKYLEINGDLVLTLVTTQQMLL